MEHADSNEELCACLKVVDAGLSPNAHAGGRSPPHVELLQLLEAARAARVLQLHHMIREEFESAQRLLGRRGEIERGGLAERVLLLVLRGA